MHLYWYIGPVPYGPHLAQDHADKGCFGLYMKLCDFTLLFMILQVELRLNKGSLVRPRLVDQVNTHVHH